MTERQNSTNAISRICDSIQTTGEIPQSVNRNAVSDET